MADVDITPAGRDISAIMRKVHTTDTIPEVVFREALDVQNIHYLTSTSDLPGKPDLIMPAQHIAIFIDGDYWHVLKNARKEVRRDTDGKPGTT